MCFGGGGGGGNTSKETKQSTTVVTNTTNIAHVNDPKLAEYISEIEGGQTDRAAINAAVQWEGIRAIGHGLSVLAEGAAAMPFTGAQLAGHFANTGRDVAYMGGAVAHDAMTTGANVAGAGTYLAGKAIDVGAQVGGNFANTGREIAYTGAAFGNRVLDTADRALLTTSGAMGYVPEIVKLGTEAIGKVAAVAEAGYAARGGNETTTVKNGWDVNSVALIVGMLVGGATLYAMVR